MHMVDVKLCVATSSRAAALGMGRVTCSKLNEISLKLERRESPSTGNFTLAPRPCPPRPAFMPRCSSPGGGRKQGSDPIMDGRAGAGKLPGCGVLMHGGAKDIAPPTPASKFCCSCVAASRPLALPLFFMFSTEWTNLHACPRLQVPVLENSKQGFGLGRNSAVSWAKVQSAPILHSFARQNLHMRVNCTAFFCSALVMLQEGRPPSYSTELQDGPRSFSMAGESARRFVPLAHWQR